MRMYKVLISATLVSGILVLPVRAQATAQPIDVLQEKVLKPRKSLVIKALGEGYDHLREARFAEALKRVLSVQKNKEFKDFGDYATWIAATAELELAKKACSERKFQSCSSLSGSATSRLLQIIEQYPYSPLQSEIQKELAVAELVRGKASCGEKKWVTCRRTIEGAFQRLASSKGLGLIRPEFLMDYGEACAEKTGELCHAWFQKLVSFFPKNSAELKSLSKHAGIAIERQRPSPTSARRTRSYKAPDLDLVAFDGAMGLYFEQKWDDAIKALRQFLDDYPRSVHRYRAQYWLGQAFGQEQKHEDARKTYAQLLEESPLTYYGLLAALALGQDIGAAIEARLPEAAATDPFLSPQEIVRLKRAEALLAGRAFAFAGMELREIRARESLSSPFLMYLAMLNHEARSHSAAFSLVGELIQRNYEGVFSSYVLRMIFPTPYRSLVEKHAAQAKLDPLLVLSLMKQESAFDSSAASGAGAQGLMQLMHSTALDMLPELSRWELANSETNVRAGTKYLGKLMTRFNGNIVYALAGYNAGPNAVERWIKAGQGKRGMLEFIESIPYRETREYVAGIIRNYYWYAHILDEAMPKTVGYFWNVYGPAENRVKPVSAETPAVPATSASPSPNPSETQNPAETPGPESETPQAEDGE